MPADKKAELNAMRRESYHRKKAEREAAQNDTQNLGTIFTTRHSVCVAHVINETNTSNGVVEHLTSELNERTTDDFDDSWLRHNDTFQTIPMEVLSQLSLVERRRVKDRERWSKRYLNMTNDQKAKKKCQQAIN
ncbi:hypothetical protein PVAP13_3NG120400 [Panicum virgatum]|nr:hypothetical protein PVAP13_3NG120400 [Panicum virgatum]KAG2619650.1 hypothetical protein PVAP13_3NG120400 [Panicum virgatum]